MENEKAVVDRRESVAATEKGSSGYANSTAGQDLVSQNAKSTRKLFLKLDLVILPFAILLYLSAYLDRGNLGNARLQGLEAQALDNSDDKYYKVTYIVLSTPVAQAAKSPSRVIAIGALLWSVAASCQAAVQNPAGVYVCRLFVGIGEALFGQAMVFYLSLWYPRTYLAKRVGIFISAGAVAGAFGGLIAYGVAKIANSSIAQWRILFLIEGIPSVFLAIMVWFFLPSRPESSRFLKEDERTLLLTMHNQGANVEHESGIYWPGVKRAALNPITYILAIAYSCNNLDLGSVSGFLPTIIKNLGYTNADAQLYSVPPYAAALGLMLVLCTYSDHFKSRGIPAACCFLVNLIGWVILIAVDPVTGSLRARYFACHCVVAGAYTAIPILAAMGSNNCPDQSQRAYQLGMLNTVGQCLSVLASYSFPSSEGPKYIKGASLNIAFSVLGLVISLGLSGYYRMVNRSRDRKEGTAGHVVKPGFEEIRNSFDKAPGFRYTP